MVKQFEEHEYDEIESWCKKRGITAPPTHALPRTGFIYPGVAAGFYYATNSSTAFIDGYFSNPTADPDVRNKALNEITEALLAEITSMGYRYVKCDSQIPAVISRAKAHGFKVTGTFTSLFREL